jgi:hypothetical protein
MTTTNAGAVDAAVAIARTALGLDAAALARAWPVARMRPGENAFTLVVFGPPERASAIAAIDAVSGAVLESARLPGHGPHTLLGADGAIQRAGFAPGAEALLLWDPSPASRSRFYPLWQLRDAGRTVWVDSVRGLVWPTLEGPRAGG